MKPIERRSNPNCELRAVDADVPTIAGYAAVFDSLSEPLGGYREMIARGAFAKTLSETPDIRALWNHDTNIVLGRVSAGTLRVWEDDKGLAIEITPPDTQWGRDIYQSIKRGDVNQMSFAFQPIIDSWRKVDGDLDIRTLIEVKLREVSPVTFPAYTDTTIEARAWSNIQVLRDDGNETTVQALIDRWMADKPYIPPTTMRRRQLEVSLL